MRAVSRGRRALPRTVGCAVLLTVGLAACVELAPVPEGEVSVGFYQPAYPHMVLVPGYPVYYDPYVRANYFFYDSLYWLYQHDNWYASSWYNGPWGVVGPQYVPYYVLRVPVRYYRAPPPYFRGWHENEPPHWGQHWGRDWEHHRPDWNGGNHRSVPPAAPLPVRPPPAPVHPVRTEPRPVPVSPPSPGVEPRRPKPPPPAVSPSPAPDTAPPAQSPRSVSNNGARVDQP